MRFVFGSVHFKNKNPFCLAKSSHAELQTSSDREKKRKKRYDNPNAGVVTVGLLSADVQLIPIGSK